MRTCEPILGRLRKAVPRPLVVAALGDKIVAALGTCVARRDCGTSRQGPSTDARLIQNGKPSLFLPDRPLPGLAAVLVDVILETIERIREQDDTVLLLEQHALVAFEIAEYLACRSLASSTCWEPKLLEESFVTAANLEGHW